MAFLNLERKFADGRDLNRSFPGNKNGSLAANWLIRSHRKLFRWLIMSLICTRAAKINLIFRKFDMTTLIPKILILARKIQRAFYFFAKQSSGRFDSQSSEYEANIPVIVFEGGKSRQIDEDVVKIGVKGVLNVMDHLGIRQQGKEIKNTKKKRKQLIYHNSRWVRAKNSGMFQPLVKNGTQVQKDQLLRLYQWTFCAISKKGKIADFRLYHLPESNSGRL